MFLVCISGLVLDFTLHGYSYIISTGTSFTLGWLVDVAPTLINAWLWHIFLTIRVNQKLKVCCYNAVTQPITLAGIITDGRYVSTNTTHTSWFTRIVCEGDEETLMDCVLYNTSSTCSHNSVPLQTVGLQCFQGETEGEMVWCTHTMTYVIFYSLLS